MEIIKPNDPQYRMYPSEPEEGYKYEIMYRTRGQSWEHLDYAADDTSLEHLYGEYCLAYKGQPYNMIVLELPRANWPKK